MTLGKSRPWAVFAAAGGAAIFVLIIVITILNQTEPEASPTVVAIINDEPILHDTWLEAFLVDQVMSGLAGYSPPGPEEKLNELVNQALVLQAAPQEEPTEEQIEEQIAALEAHWGIQDEQVVAALDTVNLQREALVRAMTHIVKVQQAQDTIATAEGISISEWLSEQHAQAQIEIYYDQIQLPPITPMPPVVTPPSPTASSESPLLQAPDFTLPQAGSDTFTLSEQLEKGPVVLVFFRNCG